MRNVRPEMGAVVHGCLIPTTRGVCKEGVDRLEWVNTKHYTSRPLAGVRIKHCYCQRSTEVHYSSCTTLPMVVGRMAAVSTCSTSHYIIILWY